MTPPTARHTRHLEPLPERSPGRTGRPRDEGQVTAFVVVMIAGLLVVAGLVLDGGLGLRQKVRAINEAQEAARAGAQRIDLATYRAEGDVVLNPGEAVAAARAYLAAAGNPDAATAPVTVTGDQVTVTVTRTQSTQLLRIAGRTSFTVNGSATARAAHGVEGPQP